MKDSFFLTEVAQDWGPGNLSVIREVLEEAETATLARSDRVGDPLLDTPNLPNVRGNLRWVLVQKCFEIACRAKRFEGIAHEWIDLGGAHTLELRGKYTSVTPCHLLTEGETPRETDYRKDLRISNQVCQSLPGFAESPSAVGLLRLLLVHGGRETRFAYLRAYIDSQNRSKCRDLTGNILHAPVLLTSLETEAISEPEVQLKKDRMRKNQSNLGDGNE
jgi:hypothetical protein